MRTWEKRSNVSIVLLTWGSRDFGVKYIFAWTWQQKFWMAEKSQDIFTEGKIDTIPVLREVRLFLGQYPAEDKLISFRGCRIAQVFAECKGPGDRNPSLFHPETSERNGRVAIEGGYYFSNVF